MKIKLSVLLCVSILIGTIAYARMTTMIVGGSTPAAGGGGDSALYTAATEIWDMEAASSTNQSGTKSTHTLTYNGDPAQTADPKQGTYSTTLDGTDDYFYVADHVDFEPGDADYSFAFWIKWTSLQDGAGIFQKGDCNGNGEGLEMWTEYNASDDSVRFKQETGWANDMLNTEFEPTEGTWYHIAGAFDASENEFIMWISTSTVGDQYTNSGSPLTADDTVGDDAGAFEIGRFSADESKELIGLIDEFVWWKGYELTATDVTALLGGSWR